MSTLFVEAFGQLLPHGELRGIDVEEEDLYSVFNSRAKMMLWSTTAMPRPAHPAMGDERGGAGGGPRWQDRLRTSRDEVGHR